MQKLVSSDITKTKRWLGKLIEESPMRRPLILKFCVVIFIWFCLGGCQTLNSKGKGESEAQKKLGQEVGKRITYDLLNKMEAKNSIKFDVKIINKSPQVIHDIEIECNFITESGTQLGKKSHIISRGVAPGAIEFFPRITMRLPAHTVRAFCFQTYLKYGNERLLTLAPAAPGGSSWFAVNENP